MPEISPSRLRRMRLAAQGLTPETGAADALEAVRAVVGVQAQDVRASHLAIRSRVAGAERDRIAADEGLVRTWTVRGTAHLIAAEDLPWISALTGPRNRRRFEGLIDKRGDLELARRLLPDFAAVLEQHAPLTRAELLAHLAELGRPALGPRSVNVLMPWLAGEGVLVGLPDGRFRPAEPTAQVDEDEALATLGRRYLGGYGPAGPADLAKWSGLPASMAKRALAACEGLQSAGDLMALPGTLDAEPPPAPSALLLGAYDTSMLGWRTRDPLVAAHDDVSVLPGGGVVKPVLLARGKAAATWRIGGSGRRRKLELDPFSRGPAKGALADELADVGRFLGLDLELATETGT